MNFIELETFLAIARQRSLAKAAATLKISQPTASIRLRSLEETLGTPLCIRTPRGMQLTPAGESLVPIAERILQLANEGASSARLQGGRRRLVIASIESISSMILPYVLMELYRRQPNLEVKLLTAPTNSVVEMVMDGVARVGFVGNRESYAGLRRVELIAEPAQCVVHQSHPLLSLPSCRLADLVGHPVVIYRWRSDLDPFLDALKAGSEDQLKVWEVLPTEAVKRFLELGAVGFIPPLHVQREVQEGSFCPLQVADMPYSEYYASMICREGMEPDGVTRDFLEILGKHLPNPIDLGGSGMAIKRKGIARM